MITALILAATLAAPSNSSFMIVQRDKGDEFVKCWRTVGTVDASFGVLKVHPGGSSQTYTFIAGYGTLLEVAEFDSFQEGWALMLIERFRITKKQYNSCTFLGG